MGEFGYRKSIIDHLEVVSNQEKQLSVGLSEIICMWFDDFYLPADDPELFNPGVFDKSLKEFNSCFTKNELEALKIFHEYFELIVKDMDTNLPLETIQHNPLWINLTKKASEVLNEFKPHPTWRSKSTGKR